MNIRRTLFEVLLRQWCSNDHQIKNQNSRKQQSVINFIDKHVYVLISLCSSAP